LTTPKLKKIIKEKYNEERKYHQPVYLYEFLIDGYLKWKAKHKMKIALNATKKEMKKNVKRSNISLSSQSELHLYNAEKKFMELNNWLFELPLSRISEQCKQQIRELILVDLNYSTDDFVEKRINIQSKK